MPVAERHPEARPFLPVAPVAGRKAGRPRCAAILPNPETPFSNVIRNLVF